jgi:hypothetical protein
MAKGWGGRRENSGGRREGAGRPGMLSKAAEATKRRREIIDTAVLTDEITPLELMLRTMRAQWGAATSGTTLDLELATQAFGFAEKCAPYLHPRLAMTAISAEVRTEPTVSPEKAQIIEDLAIAEAFAAAGSAWPPLPSPAQPQEASRVAGAGALVDEMAQAADPDGAVTEPNSVISVGD